MQLVIFFKKYGFKVDYLINPKRQDITKKLNQLAKSLSKNDNLLIYYAGHGKEEEERVFGFHKMQKKRIIQIGFQIVV